MTKRKQMLKNRRRQFLWSHIGMYSDGGKCQYCGSTNLIQVYKHDAWACIDCNEWLEKNCGSDDCPFCNDRPNTPFEVIWENEDSIISSFEKKMWRRNNYFHKKNGKKRKKKRLLMIKSFYKVKKR